MKSRRKRSSDFKHISSESKTKSHGDNLDFFIQGIINMISISENKSGAIKVNDEIRQKCCDLTAFDFEKLKKANQSGNKVLALNIIFII